MTQKKGKTKRRDKTSIHITWRFKTPFTLFNRMLAAIQRFHDEAEQHCARRDLQIDKKVAKYIPSELARDRGYGHTLEDDFIEQHEEIEGLRQLNREFCLTAFYAELEKCMADAFSDLRAQKAFRLRKNKEYRNVDDFKDAFATAGVTLTDPSLHWNRMKRLQAIRNCIAHNGGWVTDKHAARLKPYGFPEGQSIRLEEEHFTESLDAVRAIARKLLSECESVFGRMS